MKVWIGGRGKGGSGGEGGGGGGVEMTSPAQETHSREKISDKQDTTVTGTYSLLPREESGVEGQAERRTAARAAAGQCVCTACDHVPAFVSSAGVPGRIVYHQDP